ncbi:MAG: hypothetical protein Q8S84_04490 [bacterium]|nr:hypothetical protein [bacterium]
MISSFKSFNASVDNAQAGSITYQSSFRYSNIVEQTLFSGQGIISKSYSFAISYVLSHTLATLAQSTNISILSSVVFFQFLIDVFIDSAHAGSTPIILVFLSKSLVTHIIPDTTHHHQIGHIMKSGLFSISSYISSQIVACHVIILSSSNGCTKVEPFFFSKFLLALNASSNVSHTNTTSIYFQPNCLVLYTFCSGVVIGINIVPFIFK